MPAGIASLYKSSPISTDCSFAINGNYELMKHGYFPMTAGVHLKLTVFDPIDPKGKDMTELAQQIEDMIERNWGNRFFQMIRDYSQAPEIGIFTSPP